MGGMDKHSRELFNESILAEASRRFDLTILEPLDGFENQIFAGQIANQKVALRIAHDLHRTPDMVQGEIEWINYLADHGVSVPRALPSREGQVVEVISAADGSQFSAVAFEWAPGQPPRREDWEAGLLRKVGQLLGQMHRLTRSFEPSAPRYRRPDLLVEAADFEQYLPLVEPVIGERYRETVGALRTLPRPDDAYGLIHQDAHGGNFFVQDGKITIFDFDDCLYGWFVYDLAMAWMYVLPLDCRTPEQIEFARRSLGELLEGYAQEYNLAPHWLREMPVFLKLREIDLYIAIHRSLDLNNLDPWCARYMENRKTKIETRQPFVDLDWSKI